MKPPLCLLFLAAAGAASADQVVLKGGGTISGVLVKQTPEAVTIEVGAGRLTLPASRVERIVAGTSAFGEYRSRALGLRPDDTAGWLALGLWARDQGLHTQAREAFQHVLSREPGNAIAQQALGNVRLGERWVSPEESYRAQGFVYYEGQWVTREERDFALREREERARLEAAERTRAEADARAREAEARARTAEAEARRAEYEPSGYPLSWVLAGGGCCVRGFFPPRIHKPHVRPADPPPSPRPARPDQPFRSSPTTARAKSVPRPR